MVVFILLPLFLFVFVFFRNNDEADNDSDKACGDREDEEEDLLEVDLDTTELLRKLSRNGVSSWLGFIMCTTGFPMLFLNATKFVGVVVGW